jgi:hypothetical protein
MTVANVTRVIPASNALHVSLIKSDGGHGLR